MYSLSGEQKFYVLRCRLFAKETTSWAARMLMRTLSGCKRVELLSGITLPKVEWSRWNFLTSPYPTGRAARNIVSDGRKTTPGLIRVVIPAINKETMNRTFAETYGATQGQPIPYRGRLVYPGITIPVERGLTLVLRSISFVERPKQFLYIDAKKAKARAHQTVARSMKLSAEDIGHGTSITFDDVRSGASVVLWNAWEDPKERRLDAGVNNTGMIVEPFTEGREGGRVLCADGYLVKEPQFDSLVFEYELHRAT
jgi:hypothetical protein